MYIYNVYNVYEEQDLQLFQLINLTSVFRQTPPLIIIRGIFGDVFMPRQNLNI